MELAKAKGVTITLPVDFVVSSKFGEDGEIGTATKAEGIKDGFMGLDCGPESIKLNSEVPPRPARPFPPRPLVFCFERLRRATHRGKL